MEEWVWRQYERGQRNKNEWKERNEYSRRQEGRRNKATRKEVMRGKKNKWIKRRRVLILFFGCFTREDFLYAVHFIYFLFVIDLPFISSSLHYFFVLFLSSYVTFSYSFCQFKTESALMSFFPVIAVVLLITPSNKNFFFPPTLYFIQIIVTDGSFILCFFFNAKNYLCILYV